MSENVKEKINYAKLWANRVRVSLVTIVLASIF